MTRIFRLIGIVWLLISGPVIANPVQKTVQVNGLEREYMVYIPSHPVSNKPAGILVCLHGFGRTMNDFFEGYNITGIADSLNLIIAAPQALPEQNALVNLEAAFINLFLKNPLSLVSVWGCGLGVRVTSMLTGKDVLNEEMNKDLNDVSFINRMIDEVLSDYDLQEENLFVLGTSMGGYMTYQYALINGKRLSGIISIAGSMGTKIKGMDYSTKIPVCDFHSITDEVVSYTGSEVQLLHNITLAMPKTDVINYWAVTNSTGTPVTEPVRNYPTENKITVEKITYPEPENEVIHYRINGASHGYFFKKDSADCMDHVEEICRFIQSHTVEIPTNNVIVKEQQLFFYPNPVLDKININKSTGIITIYDVTGRNICSQSFTDGQADLSFLKPGLYFIRIQSGNTIQTAKLIKKF